MNTLKNRLQGACGVVVLHTLIPVVILTGQFLDFWEDWCVAMRGCCNYLIHGQDRA